MSSPETSNGLVNARDVAEAVSGIANGVLFRSEAPTEADVEGVQLAPWPPATVIDLRHAAEATERHPFADHSEIVSLPILDGSPNEMASSLPTSLGELYVSMLAPPAAHRLVEAISLIAQADGAVLVHCSAGKDRTGVVCALALALVDAPRHEIVQDYTRTDSSMEIVMSRLRPRLAAMMDQPMPEVPDAMTRAPADAIEAMLAAADAHASGAEGWFVDNGGEIETLNKLRIRLAI